jgi:hypothetical protein
MSEHIRRGTRMDLQSDSFAGTLGRSLLSPLLPFFALLTPTRMVYTHLRLTVGKLGSG